MPIGSHLQDEQQERTGKSTRLVVIVSLLFLVLFFRLIQLQIVDAAKNLRLSNENSMQLRILKAPRGMVFDRDGQALARNRPSYSICVLPHRIKNRAAVISNLCKIRDSLGQPVFDSTNLLERMRRASYRRFDPSPLKEDVSLDLVSIIEEHSIDLPGIVVEVESRREYPLGSGAFHVLGYMGEIPEQMFDSLKQLGYQYGDFLGKSGLERRYETEFRGKDGREYIEVNAYGKRLGAIAEMPRIDPLPGNDLYLTIDADLQRVARESFPDSLRGSVVMIDPRSGEVLLMFSSPGLDPNIFSLAASLRNKYWAEAATDPLLPLNNRATSGTYTPGSTFKLISAVAALESGKVQTGSFMPRGCSGAYRIGSRIAHCWKLTGHGRFSLIDAVRQSCNIYFYQLGQIVGDRTINKYANMFGLGAISGIDLPHESPGWLSGEEEYNKRFARRGWKWTGGLVLDLAIGQTQVVTPIQLACMVGAMGNGQDLYRPYLVKEIRSRDGIVITQFQPQVKQKVDISEGTVSFMRSAMLKTIEPGGTGGQSAVPGIPVGGKTGSAQNPHGDKTHALFVACAPVNDPIVAIAVVVENAGHGGSVAAPIAGKVLRYYFANEEDGRRVLEQLSPETAAKHTAAIAAADNTKSKDTRADSSANHD